MGNPKLSFVVTGRNDDYGGNLINRSSTFARVLAYLAEKYQVPSEIVFVEYNPIPNKKYLFEELPQPVTPFLTMRGIIVPTAFHDRIRKNNIPLLEYIGKNIGIRRAQGEYIIATNPDIVFSDEIMRHFAERKLDDQHFYRTDRYELETNFFPESLSPQEILTTCEHDVIKILYSPRTHYTSYRHWLKRVPHGWRNLLLCPLFNSFYPPDRASIYENASGDFTMAHHDVWEKARGYDQTPHNLHHDGLMLHVFRALGYKQDILPEPIYHISHQEGRAGRPGIAFEEYRTLTAEMEKTKIPHIVNGSDWGFADEQFGEVTLD